MICNNGENILIREVQEKCRWFWLGDDNYPYPYDYNYASILENNYNNNINVFQLNISSRDYNIDLNSIF